MSATNSNDSAENAAFRLEVRQFIEDNLSDELREAGRLQTGAFPHIKQAREWQRICNERGWGAPSWPKEYGGTGWSFAKRQIFLEECFRAGAPRDHLQSKVMCGPCLMGYGTQEQKDYYLPRILSGEHLWCQGYSEPHAGSDLAALTMSAVSDGDDYILNGSKIWTSNAHEATHMFLLVRTSTEGKPQQGITFLLMEMDTPGVTVEPIINLNGIHEQNTVFFDNVRVPKANRVGEENNGWTVAKYLLEFERGGMSVSPEVRHDLKLIKQGAAQDVNLDGEPLIEDRVFRRKLAEKEIEVDAMEFTESRIKAEIEAGGSPGQLASLVNVVAMELAQDVHKLATEAAGIKAIPLQKEALTPASGVESITPYYALTAIPKYLDGRAGTIAGGSSEVQRSIIAKSILGF